MWTCKHRFWMYYLFNYVYVHHSSENQSSNERQRKRGGSRQSGRKTLTLVPAGFLFSTLKIWSFPPTSAFLCLIVIFPTHSLLGLESVQVSCSVVSDSLPPHELQHARPTCPSPTPAFTQAHVHWVRGAIQPSHPLSSPSPPAFSLSQNLGLFQLVSSSNQVAKVLEFQLQYQSSNEYSGLISFRIDWLDLLGVQGTLKSLLQHHRSKASILRHSAFFTVQLSNPHTTTGKTIALTRWTFVGKVMSLLFNMLSRLVITFLLRSSHHL